MTVKTSNSIVTSAVTHIIFIMFMQHKTLKISSLPTRVVGKQENLNLPLSLPSKFSPLSEWLSTEKWLIFFVLVGPPHPSFFRVYNPLFPRFTLPFPPAFDSPGVPFFSPSPLPLVTRVFAPLLSPGFPLPFLPWLPLPVVPGF